MMAILRISLSLAAIVTLCMTVVCICEADSSVNIMLQYRIASLTKLSMVSGFRSSASRSVMECAVSCSFLRNVCQGFVFQADNCGENWTKAAGNCYLVLPTGINHSFTPSAARCQRLYVNDRCSNAASPCVNGATCDMASWPQICSCKPGYTGTYCETGVTILSTGINLTESSLRFDPTCTMFNVCCSFYSTVIPRVMQPTVSV